MPQLSEELLGTLAGDFAHITRFYPLHPVGAVAALGTRLADQLYCYPDTLPGYATSELSGTRLEALAAKIGRTLTKDGLEWPEDLQEALPVVWATTRNSVVSALDRLARSRDGETLDAVETVGLLTAPQIDRATEFVADEGRGQLAQHLFSAAQRILTSPDGVALDRAATYESNIAHNAKLFSAGSVANDRSMKAIIIDEQQWLSSQLAALLNSRLAPLDPVGAFVPTFVGDITRSQPSPELEQQYRP